MSDEIVVIYKRIRTGRMDHTCWHCGRIISKGERYLHVKAKYNGQVGQLRECNGCSMSKVVNDEQSAAQGSTEEAWW